MDANEKPFSFNIKVGQISANPVTVKLEAEPQECEALAKLWNIEAVKSLKATVDIKRWKRDGLILKANYHTVLTQTCVVSLKPIDKEYEDEFRATFVPENSRLARMDNVIDGEIIIDPEGPDIPDTFEGNTLDIAEIVAEYIALGIDPYPRYDDAEIDKAFAQDENSDEKPSPFAALAAIKDKLE